MKFVYNFCIKYFVSLCLNPVLHGMVLTTKLTTIFIYTKTYFMKKNWLFKMLVLTCVTLLSFTMFSCGVKDSDIQKSVNEQLASTPGISGSVDKGVVTLSGQASDDAAKNSAEANVKTVKGVKSVMNNVSVTPPVVNAPVTINPDETLMMGTKDAIKDFEGVNASVADGVITLTGSLKRSRLQNLMQALNTLKPKKINNQLTLQ